jgi:hypothetical protein
VFIFVEDRFILSRKLNEDCDGEVEDPLAEFVYNNLLDDPDDDASSEALSS